MGNEIERKTEDEIHQLANNCWSRVVNSLAKAQRQRGKHKFVIERSPEIGNVMFGLYVKKRLKCLRNSFRDASDV